MLPRVILHNSVSADGRLTGFEVDMGLHYKVAGRFRADAHLAGSETMLAMQDELTPDGEGPFERATVDPTDTRWLLVVPDSRGRFRKWYALRQTPYWREPKVALVSRSTPSDYLCYLEERHVEHIAAGGDHVDLREAFEALHARYAVRTILTDSGGTLNGILLRAGLAHEVSLLVHPVIVGGDAEVPVYRALGLDPAARTMGLELLDVEKLGGRVVWLHYRVP